MKKLLLFCLLFSVILFLAGCISSQETENQAAQALAQLSDEELQQLEEETAKMAESKAIAGQVIRLPSSATFNTQTAARLLQRTNRNSRLILISEEIDRRTIEGAYRPQDVGVPCVRQSDCRIGLTCRLDSVANRHTCQPPRRRQDDPCASTTDCMIGLTCRYDSVTRRNTCQWYPEGQPCESNNDCLPLICAFNGSYTSLTRVNDIGLEYHVVGSPSLVCEEVNQLGEPCLNDQECESGLCGCHSSQDCLMGPGFFYEEGREFFRGSATICETPMQPLDSQCSRDIECASGLCGAVYVPGEGDQMVCEEPNSLGELCYKDEECLSGLCGLSDIARTSNEGVTVETAVRACEMPNQQPEGSLCFGGDECASGICDDDHCT